MSTSFSLMSALSERQVIGGGHEAGLSYSMTATQKTCQTWTL